MSVERILAISRAIPRGHWTTYADVGEVVYGHRRAGQTVGNVMRDEGGADSAHRVLLARGRISPHWRGDGGGPEECVRRLRSEGAWDGAGGHARSDGFLNPDALRGLRV